MQSLSLRTQLAEQLTAATSVTPSLYRDRYHLGLLYRVAPASVELWSAHIFPPWSVQDQGFVLPAVDVWQWLKARSQPWPSLAEPEPGPRPPACPVWPLQLAHARCWQRCDTIAAVNPRWLTEPTAAIAPVLWPVLACLIDLADVWQGPVKPVLVIARDRLLPALDQLDRQPIPSLPRAETLDLYRAAAATLAACLQRWGQSVPRSL